MTENNILNDSVNNIAPFMEGVIKNARGMLNVLNGIKNDPSITKEQKDEIDKKLKEAGLTDIDTKFNDAISDLKKAAQNANH